MQILGRQLIREFIRREPTAQKPLKRWEVAVGGAEWMNPGDVKRTYGSASFVGKTTVFNVGGNKWRLLSHILYSEQTVVVTNVLTHKEYDRVKIE